MTVAQAHEIALQHHRAGRYAEAETLYRQILAVQPQNADVLHLLGVLAHQVGRNDAAVELIQKALALAPDAPAYHSDYGEVCRQLGRTQEAIAACRRALELMPDYADAHYNLGNALVADGRYEQAVESYRRTVQLMPAFAGAQNNMGVALTKLGRNEEAIEHFRLAAVLMPEFADAHNNLGHALTAVGRLAEAADACRLALRLNPRLHSAQNNLGNALMGQGKFDEAATIFRSALPAQPDCPDTHFNLGNALANQCCYEGATAEYRHSLRCKHGNADVWNALGNAFTQQGLMDEALPAFRHALELRPDFAVAHSSLLLGLHHLPDCQPETVFAEHCRWSEIHAQGLAKLAVPHGNIRDAERRLRIGYVSPDFREHSVAYFIEALLSCHDGDRVEILCYADMTHEDQVTARMRGYAVQWRKTTGIGDDEMAELIRRDGIDILVDLAGHTAGNRLPVFARRPAPVQVTYLGYPDTTGMAEMDYRLTDVHADPPGLTEHLHTEKLVRLRASVWCYRPAADAPPVGALPAAQSGHVTFGSFNAMAKMSGGMPALWARLLMEVPGSRLLLKNSGLAERAVREGVLEIFARAGVVAERVDLMGRTDSVAEHLAAYGRVDIALDTFPYHGTTTTCEALWMGVPVVTLAGRTHASRVGVSLLKNVGLPELIAGSEDEYISIATKLAADTARLAELRAIMRDRLRGSVLMDGVRFARNVEDAYRKMWRVWCAKQA